MNGINILIFYIFFYDGENAGVAPRWRGEDGSAPAVMSEATSWRPDGRRRS